MPESIRCMVTIRYSSIPSLEKTFALVESTQLEFRVDAFNTFNHPDFGTPDSVVGDGGEGQVSSTSVDNRRLQFSLRFSF